ncbi:MULTISPECIES: acyl-CoA dehydrogenase family protein [Nocardia]|uniref:acyl-CoA dehydrogenase family protein n=1 Tax=Nocardia TaxID=1817 RepID=UPI001893D066|nr:MULTISPECIES: acyl-CoA dehydrogenase family protein [Nocardia]MBF6349770.1 acyl-CoA/acyl-ACP dehydrogenase [Nocardia flavorosea]
MDFTRDEAQEAVAEVVVGLLEREAARDGELWPKLAATGLLSVALPERFGGDDMGIDAISVLLTELATDAVAAPALPTLGFGVLPLLGAVPESVAAEVFPAVAEGAVLTAAISEPGAPLTTEPTTKAEVSGDTVRITGYKVAVPCADQARWLLVTTESGVAVVDAKAAGLSLAPSSVSGGLPEFSVKLDGVQIPADRLLSDAGSHLHRIVLAAIGAVADGLLSGAVKLTAAHVGTRQQFNRPLAEFQAVAQQIADLYVVSRTLHVAAVSANWALGQSDPSPEHQQRIDDDLNVLAYTVAAELPRAMQKCHHLHGGIGVDVTHSMHRYYSQSKDIARWLGGAALRLERLGAGCSSI